MNQEYAEMDDAEVKEFFILGAALGDPLCYFRISQVYLLVYEDI